MATLQYMFTSTAGITAKNETFSDECNTVNLISSAFQLPYQQLLMIMAIKILISRSFQPSLNPIDSPPYLYMSVTSRYVTYSSIIAVEITNH